MMYTRILRILVVLSTALLATPHAWAINLGGKDVPKDKFIVFFIVGNCATAGNQNPGEQKPHPRLWMLDMGNAAPEPRQWQPAVEPFYHAKEGGTWRGGVGYPMLQALTEAYPDYHFGIICTAIHGYNLADYQKGASWHKSAAQKPYAELVEGAKLCKDQATFGGMLVDFNRDEVGFKPDTILPMIKKFAQDVREDLGAPNLPMLFGEYALHIHRSSWDPALRPGARALISTIGQIPDAVPNSVLVPLDDVPFADSYHYSLKGVDLYGRRVAAIWRANGWGPDTKKDTQKPTAPAHLRMTAVSDHCVALAWDPSTDNTGIHHYEIYCDDKLVPVYPDGTPSLHWGTANLTHHAVGALAPATQYTFTVKACDYAGNRSDATTPLSATTLDHPNYAPMPLKINVGGPATGEYLADKPFSEGEDYGYVTSPAIEGTLSPAAAAPPKAAADPLQTFREADNIYRIRVKNGRYRVLIYLPDALWSDQWGWGNSDWAGALAYGGPADLLTDQGAEQFRKENKDPNNPTRKRTSRNGITTFTFDVDVTSETLTCGRVPRIAALAIEPYTVLINPDGGEFMGSANVTLKAQDDAAEVHYTTDGTEPTKSSRLYSQPLAITATTTLKVKAIKGNQSLPTITRVFTKVDGRPADNPAKTEPGLSYTFHLGNNPGKNKRGFQPPGISKVPDFAKVLIEKTGITPTLDLSPRTRDDNFAFLYTGFIEVPADGRYTFAIRTDGGAVLKIGDKTIVDHDGLSTKDQEAVGDVQLKKGKHAFSLAYVKALGNVSLDVAWESPDLPRQTIPASVFSHTPAK